MGVCAVFSFSTKVAISVVDKDVKYGVELVNDQINNGCDTLESFFFIVGAFNFKDDGCFRAVWRFRFENSGQIEDSISGREINVVKEEVVEE